MAKEPGGGVKSTPTVPTEPIFYEAYRKWLAQQQKAAAPAAPAATTRPLTDVMPWATQIQPYETFYTRAITEYLTWASQNRPEWVAQYFGFQMPELPQLQPFVPGGVGGAGAGAGAGGVGELPAPRFTLRDILEHLQFPQQWQYPAYLKDFGRYLEELITLNPQYAIPVPELTEAGLPLPSPEDLDTLEYMETAQSYAAAWNSFLEMLLGLPFFQRQPYVGLRYAPETGWYRGGGVPMLPHPEYI